MSPTQPKGEKERNWFLTLVMPGLTATAILSGIGAYLQIRDENLIQRYEINTLQTNMREFKATIDNSARAFSAVAQNLAVLNEKVSTLSETINGKMVVYPKQRYKQSPEQDKE